MSLLRRRMMMAKKPSGNAEITFYIEESEGLVEYRAKQGMTWREWVSSDYNTGGYLINTRYNIISKTSGRLEIGVKPYIGHPHVPVDEIIENNYKYYYG